MYSQEEINRKKIEALARKNKNQQQNNGRAAVPATNQPKLVFSTNSVASSSSSNNGRNGNTSNQSSYQSKTASKSHIQNNRYNPIPAKPFYGIQNKVSVNIFMISRRKFAADASSYSQEFIDICKTIKSKSWDIKAKLWTFNLSDYEETVKKLADNKNLSVTGIPQGVLKIFRSAMEKQEEDVDISSIEPELVEMAKPFQIEGIKYGIAKKGRVMLADDMGLGKTIQALGIAHYYKDSWPMLIVTPSSIRYQWTEAILKHLPSVPLQTIHQVATTKDFLGSEQITIISYDLLGRMVNELEKKVFGVIIADESHFVKSSKSLRYQSISRLAKNAHHVILLSGTPALSRPVELYTQISLIKSNFMHFYEYGKRYCAGIQTKFGWNCNGSSNMQELQELLKVMCLIRRMKSEVLTQLPDKIRQVIILDPQQIKSAKAMQEASQSLQETTNKKERHDILLQYYSDTSVAKVPAVCKYVTDLIESDRKFLIFAHHKNMITAICELLKTKKKNFIKIDGETSSEMRTELVNRFQNDSSCIAAVLSITAANAGLNMTAACLVVFAELSWNPGILCQAEDRVHRIGQSNNVVIQYLIAKKTADDYMWNLLQKKMDVLKDAGLKQDFDVESMNVSNQKQDPSQPSMDKFVQPSTSSKTLSQSFNELLQDDDGFENIDFDNIC